MLSGPRLRRAEETELHRASVPKTKLEVIKFRKPRSEQCLPECTIASLDALRGLRSMLRRHGLSHCRDTSLGLTFKLDFALRLGFGVNSAQPAATNQSRNIAHSEM